MLRALLINPPSPEPNHAPWVGLQYVAASLLAHGCEARVIDAAAACFRRDHQWIVSEADSFEPHLVGVGLYTRWVCHAYRLVESLAGRFPLLVAGGPHATVRPREALDHGFDIALVGEVEKSILRVVDWLKGRAWLGKIPGICYRRSSGRVYSGPPALPIMDLDALPPPHGAYGLFDPRWYKQAGREHYPVGILTSRGCTPRGTFCANYPTGRLRLRSPASVVDELNTCHARNGTTCFSFWDDTLIPNSKRLLRLCDALQRGIRFGLQWNASVQANMITPEMLHAMKSAGCVAVHFPLISGDERILQALGKRMTLEQAQKALEWSKAERLQTTCSLMLGFPQDTPDSIKNSLRFMERISPLVDSLGTTQIVVPYPGTPLYEKYHKQYGFTDWWLREDGREQSLTPSRNRFLSRPADDPDMKQDFFRYSDEMRQLMRACLKFKADHNSHRIGLFKKCRLSITRALRG